MRFHSVNANPNNTYEYNDDSGLWVSRNDLRYAWDRKDMYPCVAAPVANYGPQDHSGCRGVPTPTPPFAHGGPATRKITCYPISHPPVHRVCGIDTDEAEALDYANED